MWTLSVVRMLHRNCWTAGSISVGGSVVAFSQLFLVWSKIARNFHLQKPSTFSISKNLQHSPSPKTFNILRPFLCLDYTSKNAQVVTNLQQTCNNAVPAEYKSTDLNVDLVSTFKTTSQKVAFKMRALLNEAHSQLKKKKPHKVLACTGWTYSTYLIILRILFSLQSFY